MNSYFLAFFLIGSIFSSQMNFRITFFKKNIFYQVYIGLRGYLERYSFTILIPNIQE